MKKLLIFLIAVSFAFITNAQYVPPFEKISLNKFTVLDSAQLRFSYNFCYKKNGINSDADTAFVVDKQSLLIGKNCSKYFSQYYFDYCEKGLERVYIHVEEGTCSFEIFKNYPANKMTVTEHAGHYILGGNMLYEEAIPDFVWKIGEDTTNILGYTCQKATTRFRGRNYIAWFAPEIPSNNGPWKFGGLPGIILKIYDDKRNFTFECSGMQQLEKPEPIKFYRLNYTKLTRKKMDKIYRQLLNDPLQFWKSIHSKMAGEVTDSFKPKWTYNPIELE